MAHIDLTEDSYVQLLHFKSSKDTSAVSRASERDGVHRYVVLNHWLFCAQLYI